MENITKTKSNYFSAVKTSASVRCLFAGLLLPLSFAPFHWPIFGFLSLALLFSQLNKLSSSSGFKLGFIFGCGYFGLGISWVFVSIHNYGHLNYIYSGAITAIFIGYLSLFIGLVSFLYPVLNAVVARSVATQRRIFVQGLVFSSLWTLSEIIRSSLFSGFPWLLLGVSQIDTPLKAAFPVVGTFGVSFLVVFLSTILAQVFKPTKQRWFLVILFVCLFYLPWNFFAPSPSNLTKPLPVGLVQANLSMREKWDENLFEYIIQRYQKGIDALLKQAKLIVLPESAVPLPSLYVGDQLTKWDELAKQHKASIVFGIPEIAEQSKDYYNTMLAVGFGAGTYRKQHLVPFGEYIPEFIQPLIRKLGFPMSDLSKGETDQKLMKINGHAIASLICYELAYPNILRQQLPKAEWIISVSDAGWFGHSFAMYQQLQIAQVLAAMTHRYHIFANNDGLSSIIDSTGNITASVPVFTQGTISENIYPLSTLTPWVKYGDLPLILFCVFLLTVVVCLRFGYSNQLD